MATQTQGTVGWVGSKNFNGTDLWSLKLTNDENFFRAGSTNPNVAKGDVISFDYVREEKNGRVNLNITSGSVKKVAEAASPTAGDAPIAGRGNTGNSVQNTIEFQSSRNAAIAVISAALSAEILPLGSSKKNKFDLLVEMVNTLTVDFYNGIVNFKENGVAVEEPLAPTTGGNELDD